ncbi:MAG: ligase-associated DNA damage response exonuclease [Planctomycetota bacterium]
MKLLRADEKGLACEPGGFWIDPWKPVPLAVITHAHSDHARRGMGRYLAAEPCVPILRVRLGKDAHIEGVPYGEQIPVGDTHLSFHPAGHCLGSAQARVESGDEVAVAAGDYKRSDTAGDPTCEPFEPIPCDTFVTEATFAMPVYRWTPASLVAAEILDWWDENRDAKRVSVIAAYSLGKAQRLLALLAAELDRRREPRRRVFIHGALEALIRVYRKAGVDMLPTFRIAESNRARGTANPFRGHLVMAPPGAIASPWVKRFGRQKDVSTAFASGWMRVRGVRRRRGYDRGFVLSDHADWPGLIDTCTSVNASRVLCTHGHSETLARYLRDNGIEADPLETGYETESEE